MMAAASRFFQVVHINIRGIRANKDNLLQYLGEFHFPDFVTINESKLSINQPFFLQNYDCIARKERRGGQHGSLILKRNDIQDVTGIEKLNQFNEEVIGVRVNGNSERPSTNIITYYNPPNTEPNSNILRICRQLKGRTIITGDFNCKHTCWGSTKNDAPGKSLLKAVNDNSLFILNTGEMTRYDPITGKEQVLDLMITNSNLVTNFDSWHVDHDIGSDHYPIRAKFSFNNQTTEPAEPGKRRNLKNANWQIFKSSLQNVQIEKPRNGEELDAAINLLTMKIIEALDVACPLQKIRPKRGLPFSPEMIAIVKEKRCLRRKKAAARRQGDLLSMAELQTRINRKNNDLKKVQKIKHKSDILKRCQELNKEKDSARFFKLFDQIRNKQPETGNLCDIRNGNETATTDHEKANLFSKRLEKIHQTKEDPSFNQSWKTTVESYVTERNYTFEQDKTNHYTPREIGDDEPLMSPITKEETMEHLKNCKNKSSPGEDGLAYITLKKLPSNVFQIIIMLFNASLSLGYFPEKWKSATIKMIPKSGKDKKEAKNWRPISLLSCLGKLYERVISSRLSSYLEKKNLLSQSQSGFRKGRMTTEQLFRLSEDSHNSLKKRGITAALFLDAEAAFDQAWHDAIRYKVDKLNIPQRLVRLISSFLKERKLKVKIGNQVSEEIIMKAGTPQGSCLSPLLYIILVNDIPNVDDHASLGQFADDIALWSNAYTFKGCINRLQKAVKFTV